MCLIEEGFGGIVLGAPYDIFSSEATNRIKGLSISTRIFSVVVVGDRRVGH